MQKFLLNYAQLSSKPDQLDSLIDLVIQDDHLTLRGKHIELVRHAHLIVWSIGRKLTHEALITWAEKALNGQGHLSPQGGVNAVTICVCNLNSGQIIIRTDPVNYQKIFVLESEKPSFSTHPNLLVSATDPLNPPLAAVASYLANGSMINSITPVMGVRLLDSASLHTIQDGQINSQKYWQPVYEQHGHIDHVTAGKEMATLITHSVDATVKMINSPLVSLSGGYDSSAILGVLAHTGRKDVHCLSYIHGTVLPGSDAAVAAQQAAIYGYTHETIDFSCDLLRLIELNASQGEGLSNFCDELYAWNKLTQKYGEVSDRTILCGDECFGWMDRKLHDWHDVLTTINVNDLKKFNQLRAILPAEVFEKLCLVYESELLKVKEKILEHDDLHAAKDSIYLEHRINHVMMNWRKNLVGNFAFVENPWLSREIIDFVSKLPTKLRLGKRLYRQTVDQMFPELLMNIPRANFGSPQTNITHQINQALPVITDWIRRVPSGIDDIIDPIHQIKLIELASTNSAQKKSSKHHSMKSIIAGGLKNAGLRPVINALRGFSRPEFAPEPSPHVLALRLLLLRRFYSNTPLPYD